MEPEKSLIVIQKKKSTDSSGILKSKLQHLKGEYKKWKHQLLFQWTKHYLLTALATEQQPDVAKTEKDLKEVRTIVDETKSDLQDVIGTLKELIEQAEQCFTEYEERSKLLEQEKESFNNLSERHKKAVDKLNDTATKNGVDNTIKEKQHKLADLQIALDGMSNSICKLEAEIKISRIENISLKEMVSSLQEQLKAHEEYLQETDGDSENQHKRLEEYATFLRTLSGITKIESDKRKFSVWLAPSDNQDDINQEDLCVTMIFQADEKEKIRLKSAEINHKTLDVDDIIKTAVLRDEVPFLIGEIKQRWHNHYPLYKEVETLRQEYALDWIPDERIVKVIYGDNGHIICTLHVGTEYPSPDSIQLKSIEGIQDTLEVSTIKPPKNGSQQTLTEWLQFLKNYLTPK